MSNLDALYKRRESHYEGMVYLKGNIAGLEDKISRLQEASSALETTISNQKDIQSTIDGIEVDESKWKGEEKDTFVEQYDSYVEKLEEFISKTEDQKDIIDEEIERAETSLATSEAHLSNMESLLDSLNDKISEAEKG